MQISMKLKSGVFKTWQDKTLLALNYIEIGFSFHRAIWYLFSSSMLICKVGFCFKNCSGFESDGSVRLKALVMYVCSACIYCFNSLHKCALSCFVLEMYSVIPIYIYNKHVL